MSIARLTMCLHQARIVYTRLHIRPVTWGINDSIWIHSMDVNFTCKNHFASQIRSMTVESFAHLSHQLGGINLVASTWWRQVTSIPILDLQTSSDLANRRSHQTKPSLEIAKSKAMDIARATDRLMNSMTIKTPKSGQDAIRLASRVCYTVYTPKTMEIKFRLNF